LTSVSSKSGAGQGSLISSADPTTESWSPSASWIHRRGRKWPAFPYVIARAALAQRSRVPGAVAVVVPALDQMGIVGGVVLREGRVEIHGGQPCIADERKDLEARPGRSAPAACRESRPARPASLLRPCSSPAILPFSSTGEASGAGFSVRLSSSLPSASAAPPPWRSLPHPHTVEERATARIRSAAEPNRPPAP